MVAQPYPTIDALETHLSKIITPLYYLYIQSLGIPHWEMEHLLSHLSLCSGIVTTLRGISFRIKRNEFLLPLDICSKHSLVQETVFRMGSEAPGLKDAVLEVATRARDHLMVSKDQLEDVRKRDSRLLDAAFPAFLQIVSFYHTHG